MQIMLVSWIEGQDMVVVNGLSSIHTMAGAP